MAARQNQKVRKQTRKTTKLTCGVKKRTTSRKTAARKRANEVTTPFRFLDLPAEIRNSIYELALYSKKTINVDRKLELPPLLASSLQIQDEASSIWYRDNEFRAPIKDRNASALNKWTAHCCTVGQRDYFNVSLKLRGYVEWENLVKWCHAIWKDDKARVLVWQDDMREDERVVCEAHNIAMESKHKPWSACLRVLEDLKIEEEAEGRAAVFGDDGLSDCSGSDGCHEDDDSDEDDG